MKKAFVVSGLLLLLAAGAAARPVAESARACSFSSVVTHPEDYEHIQSVAVIAVGTFQDAGARTATLVVEESIRGTRPGARLWVNNRLNFDCSEGLGDGFNRRNGERGLVFLRVDTFWVADYKVSVSGIAFYPIDGDSLLPPWQGAPLYPRARDVLENIRAHAGDADMANREAVAPCDGFVYEPGLEAMWTAMSTVVVRAG